MNISSRLSLSGQGVSVYALAVGCLLLAPYSNVGFDSFALDMGPLRDGEYWRVWTGHLVHNSWTHLGLNLVGLVLLQQLFGPELRAAVWLWGSAIIALIISLCFMAFSSFGYVVGMSALLHGLFAFCACLALSRDSLLAAGVLFVVGGKVAWEIVAGPSTFIEDLIGLPVAADTHLYGFVGGLIVGTVMAASASRRG